MRTIDGDALIHELNNSHYPGAPYVDAGISIAIGKVCDAPTIEPQCKTGYWILVSEPDENGNATYRCSECHCAETHVPVVDVKYCWNCGVKMKNGSVL